MSSVIKLCARVIRNEAEYKEAVQRLADERKRLSDHRAALAKTGLTKTEIKRAMDPLRSFHLQLEEEVEAYERLKRGDLDLPKPRKEGGFMIAALFVEPKGSYAGINGVDLWDEKRDARRYGGHDPVVAHPPCARWCRLAGLVEARWGHKRGEDGGCFASALAAVRKWGGVLEHPAYSDAWDAFDLPKPRKEGGWVRGECGGWSCYVEQWRYGHPAKKATWLYAFGVELPELRWGYTHDHKAGALVSWCGNHIKTGEKRPRVGKRSASATPPEFREVLLAMARSVNLAR